MVIFKKFIDAIIKLFFVMVLIVFVFLIYCFFSINVFHRPYINIFGYTYFNVGSGSMSPNIFSDDIVIVKMGDKYKIDDIVTFRYNNEFITHRIVDISDGNIVTKGDANYILDPAINKDNIVGRVIYVWSRGGLVKKVLFAPRVFIMIIITLLLIIITYSYDKDLFKKFRMRRLSKKKVLVFKRKIRERNKKERERKLKRKTNDKEKKGR